MEAPEELSALMERLNPNGLREKALLDSLAKKHDNILGSLGYHAVNLDIEHTPRYEHVSPAGIQQVSHCIGQQDCR